MRYLLIIVVLLFLVPSLGNAQTDGDNELEQKAIKSTAENCAGVGSNEVCFGYAPIEAVYNREVSPDFDTPGDILPMDLLCSLVLSPLQENEWGIALMKVHPSGFEEDVTVILFGDAALYNKCSASFEMDVEVISETDIRSGPGSHFASLGTVHPGDILSINACNCTGNWLRVTTANGQVGWISAVRVKISEVINTLPVAEQDSPVYAAMQAVRLITNDATAGMLVQAPLASSKAPLLVNDIEINLSSTAFIQSQQGTGMTIAVLDGTAEVVMPGDQTLLVPAGIQITIPLSAENTPSDEFTLGIYAPKAMAKLPLELLPRSIDSAVAFEDDQPTIIAVERCTVLSGRGEMDCPLYFVNPDGDTITRMGVEFLYAAQGDWEGSVHENPRLLQGDFTSGVLAWNVACNIGAENFVGPVIWSVTITDETGHTSDLFEASFNCQG